MYEFIAIEYENINKEEYYSIKTRSVFTTFEWINFIKEDKKANPIFVRILKNGKFEGYFSGLLFKICGIKIIGSPFRGWSTCYMGLDVYDINEKLAILNELKSFLIQKFKCMFIEIADKDISVDTAKSFGFHTDTLSTLELNISEKTDEELFKVFKTDCRNFIRQFERRGAIFEVAEPNEEFAEQYYEQLIDVFAKQGLVPTYSLKKVKCLLKNMGTTSNVLCLRVRDPEGKPIASSIFFGLNETFYFWGGASLRPYQHYRPNEYMLWQAIRHWRDRGIKTFDMVGVRDYKRKFGSVEVNYARISFSRFKILITLRDLCEKMYFHMISIKGTLKGRT